MHAEDDQQQAATLRAYTTRLSAALVFFGLCYAGAGVALHNARFGGLSFVLLSYLAAVMVAHARAGRGAVRAAAQLVAYGDFYVCIGATMLVPVAYPTLIVGCATGIAAALPYLRGVQLAAVFATGLAGAFAVAVLGSFGGSMTMPPAIYAVTCVLAPTWATYLLFSLLWQFSARLRSTLDAAQLAQGRLAFLARASEELGASLDYDAILATATRLAVPTLADVCVADATGVEGTMVRAHAGASAEAIGPDTPAGRTTATRSLVVPLLARDNAFGSMLFGRQANRPPFDEGDVALAREFARRGAWALENARLYAEAQAANRVRDEFLATVSHELRTPLQAIMGWSHLLGRRGGDPAARSRGLNVIDRSVHAQARLIDDLLDVGRVISGKLVIERRPTDCARVLRAALEAVRPMALVRSVAIELAAPDVGLILADGDRLQQVVSNLLMNAVKFTPPGGRVTAQLQKLEESVRITVRDSGEGIDPAFLPHVFDRFRQADGSSRRRHGGLGLGLTIAKQLVELHGGVVRAESDGFGKGAMFVVDLPIGAVDEGPGTVAARVHDAPSRLSGLRLLVVDDDADARDLLAAVLEDAGAAVRTASSAREALEAVRANALDLLISDVAMPEEDGYELLAKVRALSARRQAWLPAVAVTACASASDRAQALQRGFQAHLAKPIPPEALVDVVAALRGHCQGPRPRVD